MHLTLPKMMHLRHKNVFQAGERRGLYWIPLCLHSTMKAPCFLHVNHRVTQRRRVSLIELALMCRPVGGKNSKKEFNLSIKVRIPA